MAIYKNSTSLSNCHLSNKSPVQISKPSSLPQINPFSSPGFREKESGQPAEGFDYFRPEAENACRLSAFPAKSTGGISKSLPHIWHFHGTTPFFVAITCQFEQAGIQCDFSRNGLHIATFWTWQFSGNVAAIARSAFPPKSFQFPIPLRISFRSH